MILLFSCFLKKKEKERKYWVHPILKYREEGEFPYHGRFKVYFRMSVSQFDALLVILEPHIKKKTTNFCELSVQGSIVLCAARWSGCIWQSPFWILAFACTVALNCQNSSQNACHGCGERKKTKISESVCKHDWHNVRSYLFFNVRKFRTQCAMTLTLCVYWCLCVCVP